jgi:DNA-binding CsgD family transcriptional regulator
VPSPVGRDRELAAVDSFLGGGGAAALLVVGEAGVGKTTVWEEAVARARGAGALVLVARPSESEAKLSFAALADLLAPVPAAVFAELPDPQRVALDVALLRVEASGTPPERRTVGTAVLSLLRVLAAEQDVVVAVDDAHWLDRPSAAAIEFALRRLTDERVRIVASTRPDGATLPGAQRLDLGPVSVAALHEILAERLERSFPRPTLVRIAQASGGNPLFALEIARLLPEGDPGPTMPIPEGVRALVAKRVAALPDATRDALLRAAASARPDLSTVDVEALAPAEEAGLVTVGPDGRIAFVHPLFASAVYSSAPYARRRSTHAALATAVRDPEERARHLALACDGADPVVAQAVEEAARRARGRGASDTAAELAALALQLTPEGSAERDARRIALADQLQLAGNFERSGVELYALSNELPRGDQHARVLLMLSDIEYWRRGESAALELAEGAAAEAVDPQLLGRCYTRVAEWAATCDVPRAAAAANRAVALLEESAGVDGPVLAAALIARVRAQLFAGEGLDRSAAERAAELERPAPPATVDLRCAFKVGQWLRYVDDLAGSRAALAAVETSARDEGDESSLPNILLNRALVECWAGDLRLAGELADRAREGFEQVGVAADARSVWKAYVDAHAGRVDDVREAALGAEDIDEPIIRMLWERTVGLAELSTGDVAAAHRHLALAMQQLDDVAIVEPAIFRVEGDAVEAAVGTGELEQAEAIVARFERCAERSQIPWSLAVSARARALVLAAHGELDEARVAVERSLVEHERCPVVFERARTLLAHGQILRRLKQKRLARESLEEALSLFEELGAQLWASRVREELQRVAARSARDDLSATELRIARLAAAGRTNGEIAAEVFVTQKTVEANLARAYRKLGIRSRAQLAHALDARELHAIP